MSVLSKCVCVVCCAVYACICVCIWCWVFAVQTCAYAYCMYLVWMYLFTCPMFVQCLCASVCECFLFGFGFGLCIFTSVCTRRRGIYHVYMCIWPCVVDAHVCLWLPGICVLGWRQYGELWKTRASFLACPCCQTLLAALVQSRRAVPDHLTRTFLYPVCTPVTPRNR